MPDVQKVSDDFEALTLERAMDPEREWHVGVYSILCQEHIVQNDYDIVEAFGSKSTHYVPDLI